MHLLSDRAKRRYVGLMIVCSLLSYTLAQDAPDCRLQLSKWRYSMWFLIVTQLCIPSRVAQQREAFAQHFVADLVIGPFCIYPIIFCSSLLGAVFYYQVSKHSPFCTHRYTYYSALIAILVGLLLSMFFWMALLVVLCR